MSQRKKSRKSPRRVARSTRIETLESRQVMAADPLAVPELTQHAVEDEVPQLTQHVVEEEVPQLTQHVVEEIPQLTQHAIVESEPEVIQPEVVEVVQHDLNDPLSTGFVETEPVYDPNADFWIDTSSEAETLDEQISQLLYEAHGITGQDDVLNTYGFDGSGQTVVIIDSGIAYDHYALGGGYGEDYRVVGGYDFAEDDDDPYDDGPSGAHGTHVAGIVGADGDGDDSGVATGVDLVGLRVFDDAGNGYFSWVEEALDWVYDNVDAFESPITTVNLSLGAEYNAHTTPSWAMLEDEFEALESLGIFISVSAGNDFTDYNEPGVSYPASSDHVIPVMSLDSSGTLSYFSQRAEYAIAAPGRWITSTVPDYAAGDSDTITDDWASMSGTSMAAPYIAGASVIVREAMEFVGMTDIDQWDIFDHMMATGDQFYDATTDATYTQLNLSAAIEALMPADDYGSSAETAHDLGTVDASEAVPLSHGQNSGVISTLDDSDHFTFTAGATGTVTFTVSDTTHDLAVDWSGTGWSDSGSGVYTMDVVAGQSYAFSLGTLDGLGYYDFTYSLESTLAPISWGSIGPQQTQSDLSVAGEAWYSVTVGAAGYVTADVVSTDGSVTLEWYDSQQNLIASDGGDGRIDTLAAEGEELMLRVVGDATDLDVRLTNAVSVDRSVVSVRGTSGDDALEFTAGASEHTVSLNGVAYAFDAGEYDTIELDGGDGADTATLVGGSGDDTVEMRSTETTMESTSYTVSVEQVETVVAHGGGGADRAFVYDSAGDDTFTADPSQVEMVGDGFSLTAVGFYRTFAYSSSGWDRAFLHDGNGDDVFEAHPTWARLYGGDFYNWISQFDRVFAYASGGEDRALFYDDSAGDDTFDAYHNWSRLYGDDYYNYASSFERMLAFSSGGLDRAFLYDTAGDDTFDAYHNWSRLYGDGYYNFAAGFDRVFAYSTTGWDRAFFYDSVGDDTYEGWHNSSRLYGDGFYNWAGGFDRVFAYASAGDDDAILYEEEADDTFEQGGSWSRTYGSDYYNFVGYFDSVTSVEPVVAASVDAMASAAEEPALDAMPAAIAASSDAGATPLAIATVPSTPTVRELRSFGRQSGTRAADGDAAAPASGVNPHAEAPGVGDDARADAFDSAVVLRDHESAFESLSEWDVDGEGDAEYWGLDGESSPRDLAFLGD